MHENFEDLKEPIKERVLLERAAIFDKEFDAFETFRVSKVSYIEDYIVVRFETVFKYQYKTVIFNKLVKPLGIIIYSICNNKSCLDFIYIKREYRNNGLGELLIKILKYEIKDLSNTDTPIFVTPVVLDVPITDNFNEDAAKLQKRLEKFYVRHGLIIAEIAEEKVFT